MSDDQPDLTKVVVDVPDDPRGQARAALQERLGLRREPDDECDAVAQEFLDAFDGMMAGVNLYGYECGPDDVQYFTGVAKRASRGPVTEADRTMALGWGYCGNLLTQRQAPLAINTGDKPFFATNPVAQYYGVEAYLGDELRTPAGEEFATLWLIDDKEHDWKQEGGTVFVAQLARRLEDRLIERSGLTF